MADALFSDFVPKSPKDKALSKLNDIVLRFTEEHKFDLDHLIELHDLILAIKESE